MHWNTILPLFKKLYYQDKVPKEQPVLHRPKLHKGNYQLRYLSQSVMLEETTTSLSIRVTMLLICFTLIIFLIWASVANVNEVAVTKGEIIPSSHIQIIQHLEGGVLDHIFVGEGQVIEEGDPLLKLSSIGIEEDVSLLEAKHISLILHAERLKAFVGNREPDFTTVLKQSHAHAGAQTIEVQDNICLLYTSPSPRDKTVSRMPSSA